MDNNSFFGKSNCSHRRTKKNFPFGRKSGAEIPCKDCGKVITKHDLRKSKPQKIKKY